MDYIIIVFIVILELTKTITLIKIQGLLDKKKTFEEYIEIIIDKMTKKNLRFIVL